ncbi:MAG TPA: biotin transporter BioY [Candidatus Polarisedimenticolia bacterium]|jgi:biotin transport system substrate-specific component|nr:biotin transporter BioY [Candidatus Polarisedimenticolia bacterium]
MSTTMGGLVSHPEGGQAAPGIGNVRSVSRPLTRVVLVLGFALLTWAGARVSVPLPLTPVPGTLQTLAVLLAGALLGPRAGAASQVSYLLLGLAGLPVFALPGAGPAYFLGPTGGYLVGFVIAAWTTGWLVRRLRGLGTWGTLAAFLAGSVAVHACGLAWLSVFLGGPAAAWRAGSVPFLLFDLAKVMVATGIHAGFLRWKVSSRH